MAAQRNPVELPIENLRNPFRDRGRANGEFRERRPRQNLSRNSSLETLSDRANLRPSLQLYRKSKDLSKNTPDMKTI